MTVKTETDLFKPFVDQCFEDLSPSQGDPHNQDDHHNQGDDDGGVNGTGSPRHDAGSLVKTSLKSTFKLSYTHTKIKMEKVVCRELCDPPCPEQQTGVVNFSRNRSEVPTKLE